LVQPQELQQEFLGQPQPHCLVQMLHMQQEEGVDALTFQAKVCLMSLLVPPQPVLRVLGRLALGFTIKLT